MKTSWNLLSFLLPSLTLSLVGCAADEADSDPPAENTDSDDAGTASDESDSDPAPSDTGEATSDEPTSTDDSATDSDPGTSGETATSSATSGDAGPSTEPLIDGGAGIDGDAAVPSDGGDPVPAEDGGAINTDAGADAGPAAILPPAELGVFIPPAGAAQGFAVVGNTVYLAATSAGVYVVDITDPAAPVSIGQYDFPPGEQAYSVAIDGTQLAVGMRGNGWALLDVSNPAEITELARDDAATSGAEDIALRDGTLYYVDGTGVVSVDVSTPETPVPLTTDLVLPGADDQLILWGSTIFSAQAGAGFSVVDATDPAMLAELASVEVGTGSSHITFLDQRLYVSHSEGVQLFDVSDGSMPLPLGEFVRERSHEVAVIGDQLFVFGDDTNTTDVPFVTRVDVSDPSVPEEHVSAQLNTYADPLVARAHDGLLLVSVGDDDSLHLFDALPTE